MEKYLSRNTRNLLQEYKAANSVHQQQRLKSSLEFFKHWESNILHRQAEIEETSSSDDILTADLEAFKIPNINFQAIINSELVRRQGECHRKELELSMREKELAAREYRMSVMQKDCYDNECLEGLQQQEDVY